MDTTDLLGALQALTARGLETLTAMPVTTIAIAAVVALLVLHAVGPRVDPREPPVVKPRVPFLGHIIGMFQQQAGYHITLQRATRKPIATLPMLSGKMYAVWDPYLIAAGLRSKSLSSTPHILEATPVACQLSPHAVDLLHNSGGTELVERMMQQVIPATLKGPSIRRLNQTALTALAADLTALAPSSTTPTTIPNAWLWLRHLLTTATGSAIYGPHDPFAANPPAEDALWDLEKNLLKLTLNLPRFLAPLGHSARQVLFDALTPYYSSRKDTDASTSAFVSDRATTLRDAGFADGDIARLEMMLPFAALANTVPSLFWLLAHVFSSPAELVERLRKEVEGLVVSKREDGEVTLVMTGSVVEERCPLLMSCYRETQRKTVHQVSTRTAVEDTVLRGRDGREYLLKKGNVVQLVVGVSHNMEEYWGEDVDEFKPERFLRKGDSEDGPGSAKAMRAAFQPFGGGIHLCPGRNFAFAEMMAVMATLLLGFEVKPLNELPAFATRSVIDAVTKPAGHGKGFGVSIRRREGWEGVRWAYEL